MKFSTNHSGIRLHFEAGQWWIECPDCDHRQQIGREPTQDDINRYRDWLVAILTATRGLVAGDCPLDDRMEYLRQIAEAEAATGDYHPVHGDLGTMPL